MIREEWNVNHNPRVRLVLVLFRIAGALRGTGPRPKPAAIPALVVYKFVSEWCFGMEIPASTRIGPGFKVEHGHGLVIHPGSRLGRDVVVKHGVTLGIRTSGGGAPVIGDGVVIGPGAQILGHVHVGDHASIGAGAIVMNDVPAHRVAVGNPARLLPEKVSRMTARAEGATEFLAS